MNSVTANLNINIRAHDFAYTAFVGKHHPSQDIEQAPRQPGDFSVPKVDQVSRVRPVDQDSPHQNRQFGSSFFQQGNQGNGRSVEIPRPRTLLYQLMEEMGATGTEKIRAGEFLSIYI